MYIEVGTHRHWGTMHTMARKLVFLKPTVPTWTSLEYHVIEAGITLSWNRISLIGSRRNDNFIKLSDLYYFLSDWFQERDNRILLGVLRCDAHYRQRALKPNNIERVCLYLQRLQRIGGNSIGFMTLWNESCDLN